MFENREEMFVARMHAAIGEQPHDVQRTARRPRRIEACVDDLVLVDGPRAACAVDARKLLMDDAAGADVQVPDLGVSHLAFGQADRLARRLKARALAREQLIEKRRVRKRDGVARTCGRKSEAVHDNEAHGKREALARRRIENAHYCMTAFTSWMKESHLRLAPPISPPSMSGSATSASTLPGFIEPP